MITPFAITRSA